MDPANRPQPGTSRLKRRILYFAGYLTSYLPVLVIGTMASLISAPSRLVLSFLFFAIATISLELCFTTLRAQYLRLWNLENALSKAENEETRAQHIEALREAWVDCAHAWVFVGAATASWILIAFVEVAGMGDLQIASYSKFLASMLAGFMFTIALFKIWTHAGAIADDFEETDFARLTSLLDTHAQSSIKKTA